MAELGEVLYCDGGMNKQTGKDAWASVVDGNGVDVVSVYKDLFHLNEDEKIDLSSMVKNAVLPGGNRDVLVVQFPGVQQQNNGAELVGLYTALLVALLTMDEVDNKYVLKYKQIKCDSALLLDWWSKGKINAKTKAEMDPTKRYIIEQVVKFRKAFEKVGGELVKISGKDNLSDLGYHK
jgi:hypothetical protein